VPNADDSLAVLLLPYCVWSVMLWLLFIRFVSVWLTFQPIARQHLKSFYVNHSKKADNMCKQADPR